MARLSDDAIRERNRRIVAAASDPAVTLRDIAAQFHMTRQRVHMILVDEGVRLPREKPPRTPQTRPCQACGAAHTNPVYCSRACADAAKSNTKGDQRRCSVCQAWKPLDAYDVARRETGQLRPECKPCRRAQQAAWRQARDQRAA